jgi:hypothetical protein
MDLKNIVHGAARRIPKTTITTIAAIAFASAAMSCHSTHDGTLTQNWTIAEATNPQTCGIHGATQVRLIVFDPGLFVNATQFAPCESFTTSLDLHENTYTSTLTFVDVNNVPVSETRSLAAFTITNDQTTTLTADFPVTSFFR